MSTDNMNIMSLGTLKREAAFLNLKCSKLIRQHI